MNSVMCQTMVFWCHFTGTVCSFCFSGKNGLGGCVVGEHKVLLKLVPYFLYSNEAHS